MNFNQAVEIILKHEGGYNNREDDPGGETNFGISKRCLGPKNKILTASGSWSYLDELKIGDEIVGFDEKPERFGKLNIRRIKKAIIKNIGPVYLPASIITTNRTKILASDDHQWLRRRGVHRVYEWVKTNEILKKEKWQHKKIKTKIATFSDVWNFNESRDAGYLAGIVDGEASFSGGSVVIYQNKNECFDEILRTIKSCGYTYTISKKNKNELCHNIRINSNGPYSSLRFLSEIGSKRLLPKCLDQIYGKNVASTQVQHDEVLSVESVGMKELIGIETTTNTLIVEGLLSHNSYPAVNIAALTKKQAIDIYKRDYWDKNRIDEYPECIKLIYFDACVNQGPGRARQLYQLARTINGEGSELTLLEHFAKARLNHYTILPGWKTFGAGWAKRLMSIVIESYLDEHV
jgi:hypothetical protein